jgi:hypothetical protein
VLFYAKPEGKTVMTHSKNSSYYNPKTGKLEDKHPAGLTADEYYRRYQNISKSTPDEMRLEIMRLRKVNRQLRDRIKRLEAQK